MNTIMQKNLFSLADLPLPSTQFITSNPKFFNNIITLSAQGYNMGTCPRMQCKHHLLMCYVIEGHSFELPMNLDYFELPQTPSVDSYGDGEDFYEVTISFRI